MIEPQIVKVYAYQKGVRRYTYFGVKSDGTKVQLMESSKNLYAFAYEFDRSVRSCKTAEGANFLLRSKPSVFTRTPIKKHQIIFKGDMP